jgi:exopolysaccharide production protein ExoQ
MPIKGHRLRHIISDAFLISYLVMLSTVFYFGFGSISAPDTTTKAGANSAYVVIWSALYVILLIKAVMSFRFTLAALLLPTCLALLSIVAYSIHGFADRSVQDLCLLYLSFLFGVVLAAEYSPDRFFGLFYTLSCVLGVLHLAMYPFVSHLSANFDTLNRPNIFGMPIYAGLFAHKNQCGLYFGMSFLVGAARYIAVRKPHKLRESSFLVMHVVLIAMSGAMSPLLCTCAAIMSIILLHLTFTRPFVGVIATMAVFIIILVVFLGREEILAMLSRDSGLTGRVALYEIWFGYFRQHPFLGYGYGEFFADCPYYFAGELSSEFLYGQYCTFESGYMQAAIDFGILGLFIYLYMIMAATRRSVHYAKDSKAEYRLAPLALMVYIVCSSINEPYITLFNSVHVGLLAYLFKRLSRACNNGAGQFVNERARRQTPVS